MGIWPWWTLPLTVRLLPGVGATGAGVAALGLDEQPVRKKSKLINGTQRTAAGTTRIEAPRGTWSIIEMLIL
jgi:hypothetical protein